MLRGLTVENFKAFGSRTFAPLAPITLIYGPNSGGKSSLTQSLLLLKQTRESREAGSVLSPRTESGFVDLGSFQELIFDHDLSRQLLINVETRPEPTRSDRHEDLSADYGNLSLELKFVRPTLRSEIAISVISLRSTQLQEPIASFVPTASAPPISSISFDAQAGRVLPATPTYAACRILTRNPAFWKISHARITQNTKQILTHLERLTKEIQFRGPLARDLVMFGRARAPDPTGNTYWTDRVNELKTTLSGDFSLESWINFAHPILSSGHLSLDGFLPVGYSLNAYALGVMLDHSERYRPNNAGYLGLGNIVPNPTAMIGNAARELNDNLKKIFPLGPWRQAPARYYIYTGSSPSDVGYQGNLMPYLLFRKPRLLREANRWLERLEIGYELSVDQLSRGKDLFELRLVDLERTGSKHVSLTDVGYGLSQLLPFIVQAFAEQDQIITIEQPEVHIHPRLQADLGDLIVASFKRPYNNQFIIETHSEHLMLRFQKLVRDRTIRPADISILYVKRGPDGSTVTQIRLDNDGTFLDSWPGGFFPERIRELT